MATARRSYSHLARTGRVRGRTVELDQQPRLPDGTRVRVKLTILGGSRHPDVAVEAVADSGSEVNVVFGVWADVAPSLSDGELAAVLRSGWERPDGG